MGLEPPLAALPHTSLGSPYTALCVFTMLYITYIFGAHTPSFAMMLVFHVLYVPVFSVHIRLRCIHGLYVTYISHVHTPWSMQLSCSQYCRHLPSGCKTLRLRWYSPPEYRLNDDSVFSLRACHRHWPHYVTSLGSLVNALCVRTMRFLHLAERLPYQGFFPVRLFHYVKERGARRRSQKLRCRRTLKSRVFGFCRESYRNRTCIISLGN